MEKDLEKKFVAAVKRHDGVSLKFNTASGRGYPDRINLYGGDNTDFAELKDGEDKEPDPIQIIRRRELQALGYRVYLIKTEADIKAYEIDQKLK